MKTHEQLESEMAKKWERLLAKHPKWNANFMADMHTLLDWYERESARIELETRLNKQNIIGMNILKYRHEKGWSQLELGARIGLTQGTIANIESRSKNTTLDTLYRICATLGVELKDLIN